MKKGRFVAWLLAHRSARSLPAPDPWLDSPAGFAYTVDAQQPANLSPYLIESPIKEAKT